VKKIKNFKAMGAMKHAAQKGFTIIELVVVILLLGILTATALPRFLDISEEAHDSVVQGVFGGLRTGLSLYKANWFALGQPKAVLADWGNMAPNSVGFPIGTSGGTSAGITDLNTECESIYAQLMDINAGAPAVETANTLAPSLYTADSTVAAMTDAGLVEAEATAAGAFDFVAALQSSAPAVCRFWYIGDPQRLTITTTPYLNYDTTTGILTQGN
jgi:prepilin-type N-terminal cleavage/methylation domain-containing protein